MFLNSLIEAGSFPGLGAATAMILSVVVLGGAALWLPVPVHIWLVGGY
jgi:hypothetical protein